MTLIPFDLLLLALATWRISNIIALEHGPARLFSRLREGKYKAFLSCIYCVSVWVAVAVYVIWQTEARVILYPFVLSGAALMLGHYTGVVWRG